MAARLDKTPCIYNIFEKVHDRHYTKNAILRQDILSYYYKVLRKENKDNSFRLWDLSVWLVDNNLEFVIFYRGRRVRNSYKINNIKRRILNHLKELIYLRLIKTGRFDKARKTKSEVDIYEYTNGGQLLAYLIKSFDTKQQENAYKDIYDIAIKAFSTQDDSSSITISKFIAKCKEKGLFNKLVEYIQNIMHTDLNPKIVSIADLFSYIFNSSFEHSNVKHELLGIWSETIQQLEPETRKLAIFQLKIHVEAKYAKSQEFVSRQYEEFRFRLRDEYEKIAVGGDCLTCKYSGNLELHYIEYLKFIASNAMAIRCPHCCTQNLLVSNL
jgi:hypothetical protein